MGAPPSLQALSFLPFIDADAFRGAFRVAPDGRVTRMPVVMGAPGPSFMGRSGPRLATTAVRENRQGRLYFQEPQAIVILGADGALLERVDSFRLAAEQPVRR